MSGLLVPNFKVIFAASFLGIYVQTYRYIYKLYNLLMFYYHAGFPKDNLGTQTKNYIYH